LPTPESFHKLYGALNYEVVMNAGIARDRSVLRSMPPIARRLVNALNENNCRKESARPSSRSNGPSAHTASTPPTARNEMRDPTAARPPITNRSLPPASRPHSSLLRVLIKREIRDPAVKRPIQQPPTARRLHALSGHSGELERPPASRSSWRIASNSS
jgi:hypothetical protein